MESVRIQKYIAECGLMSRRAAEKEIQEGHFTVNGKLAAIGQKIDPSRDRVQYKGKWVKKENHLVYIMLNKPKGYVTTLSDEKGRKCVAELIKGVKTRVYPVGRLDMASEGLLILTNDGPAAHRQLSPKTRAEKEYAFRCKKPFRQIQKIEKGVCLADGYQTLPCKIRMADSFSGVITLTEGKYHQIKRMFEALDNQIVYLERIKFAGIALDPALPRGAFRPLKPAEQTLFAGG